MRHQVEIKRQLFRWQALVERQYEAAIIGCNEIVRVLDAGDNRLEFAHRSERVAGEPCDEVIGGDGGVDREEGADGDEPAADTRAQRTKS